MFYNYYFSLSFLCLAHFLLLCSALLVHLPRLPPLSLSLSFSYLSFRCLFCAKVYTSFDFRSGFERAKNLSVFFYSSIYLCFLLVLPSLALPFPLLSRLFCLLSWHTRLNMISVTPIRRVTQKAPPVRLDRLIRDLSILRVSPFASQLCFVCVVSLVWSLPPFVLASFGF